MRFRLSSGASIGYRVRGAGDVIVLLHPVGLDSRFWAPVVSLLESEHRVIAVDFREHGDSDLTGRPYSLAEVADDCIELIRALAGPCVLVGCSMGSAVTQAIIVKDKSLVKAAVLANGSGPRTGGRTDVLEQRAQRALTGMPAIAEENIERWFSKDFAARRPDVVAMVREWLLDANPIAHAMGWRALAGRSDQYDRMDVPVLTIAGSVDASASPASVRALADALPNARYVELAGAGHLAPLEQPEAFVGAIRSFLSEIGQVAARAFVL
jgi:pimeloyl-ACP methyl ester carboxylesterase